MTWRTVAVSSVLALTACANEPAVPVASADGSGPGKLDCGGAPSSHLAVEPDGSRPGDRSPGEAVQRLFREEGLPQEGLEESLYAGDSRAEALYVNAAGLTVVRVVAERFGITGWHGTGLSACSSVLPSASE